jgi:hypothetical protein
VEGRDRGGRKEEEDGIGVDLLTRTVFLTYENKPVIFFTYHGFVTIASSSRILSVICIVPKFID